MSLEWRDVTNYRDGERGKIEPRLWQIGYPAELSISVFTRFDAISWFVSCLALGMDAHPLQAASDKAAKREGILVVVKAAENYAKLSRTILAANRRLAQEAKK